MVRSGVRAISPEFRDCVDAISKQPPIRERVRRAGDAAGEADHGDRGVVTASSAGGSKGSRGLRRDSTSKMV